MPDKPLRMDAYYYGFDPTGNRSIDLILSAVACAGKAYHHTESWSSDEDGPSYVDRIQQAAATAAAEIERLAQLIEEFGTGTDWRCPDCGTKAVDADTYTG